MGYGSSHFNVTTNHDYSKYPSILLILRGSNIHVRGSYVFIQAPLVMAQTQTHVKMFKKLSICRLML